MHAYILCMLTYYVNNTFFHSEVNGKGPKVNKTKDEKKKDLSKCLWICGLSSITKAADLKNLFTQHGKVSKFVLETLFTAGLVYG